MLQALIKFLKSVDWNHAQEQEEAFQLLEEWEPMDVDDALELLTSQFAHLPRIRQYAVRRLETYPDEVPFFESATYRLIFNTHYTPPGIAILLVTISSSSTL